MKIGKFSVEVTHEEKILFPKSKISKKDLIDYYQKASCRMLPHLKDRPISLMRYPNGINKEGFLQKNISDYFPKWIKRVSVSRKEKSSIHMVLCNDKATLIYLINQNCITSHIWLSKKDKKDVPDRLIFDLDAPKSKFSLAIEAALGLKDILEKDLNLSVFVMTTGSNGLHVVVPIKREKNFDFTRQIAKKIAQILVEKSPKKFTTEQRKNKRGNKLFIDCMRNGFAQTSVAPYSVRAIEKAPIATPLFWKDLSKSDLTAQFFNIENIQKRLKGKDPWEGIEKKAKSLVSAEKKLNKII
jgi:bifunctional non-homologous end joining protein LigD